MGFSGYIWTTIKEIQAHKTSSWYLLKLWFLLILFISKWVFESFYFDFLRNCFLKKNFPNESYVPFCRMLVFTYFALLYNLGRWCLIFSMPLVWLYWLEDAKLVELYPIYCLNNFIKSITDNVILVYFTVCGTNRL